MAGDDSSFPAGVLSFSELVWHKGSSFSTLLLFYSSTLPCWLLSSFLGYPIFFKMQTKTKKLKIKTKKGPQFIDITEDIVDFINKSGIKDGLAAICSQHTTAAVKVNENEPLLIEDMTKFLEKLAPVNGAYNHNDFKRRTVNMCAGECANGHSHCQHLLLSTSETLPIIAGKLQLGAWQRIFLVELDHARERQVIVQVIGE